MTVETQLQLERRPSPHPQPLLPQLLGRCLLLLSSLLSGQFSLSAWVYGTFSEEHFYLCTMCLWLWAVLKTVIVHKIVFALHQFTNCFSQLLHCTPLTGEYEGLRTALCAISFPPSLSLAFLSFAPSYPLLTLHYCHLSLLTGGRSWVHVSSQFFLPSPSFSPPSLSLSLRLSQFCGSVVSLWLPVIVFSTTVSCRWWLVLAALCLTVFLPLSLTGI